MMDGGKLRVHSGDLRELGTLDLVVLGGAGTSKGQPSILYDKYES